MKGVWTLRAVEEFSAAHALRNYQGKCERLHGHNFSVEVEVEGNEIDPATGMLLDFKTLRAILKNALASLDHRLLNEEPPFDAENPSSEYLARHIWRLMAAGLAECADPQARKATLKKVTVAENCRQAATYRE